MVGHVRVGRVMVGRERVGCVSGGACEWWGV